MVYKAFASDPRQTPCGCAFHPLSRLHQNQNQKGPHPFLLSPTTLHPSLPVPDSSHLLASSIGPLGKILVIFWRYCFHLRGVRRGIKLGLKAKSVRKRGFNITCPRLREGNIMEHTNADPNLSRNGYQGIVRRYHNYGNQLPKLGPTGPRVTHSLIS